MESNQSKNTPNSYDAYLGEIQMVAFNYAPEGWAICEGQLLSTSQNRALFQLIGITYGGDGVNTFALPDLRGRFPINAGAGPGLESKQIGQKGGVESVTLSTAQLPAHNHDYFGSSKPRESTSPENRLLPIAGANYYTSANNTSDLLKMNSQAIANSGGSQPHSNMPPFLTINFIICIQGIFPYRP